jgi:glycine betaine/proline transport system substrate-binding protein
MTTRNNLIIIVLCFVTLTILLMSFGGSSMAASKKLVFSEFNWNSIQVHNRIAAFILKHGYGYEIEYTPLLESVADFFTLARGEADINMEVWVELQQEAYAKALVAGHVLDLGSNFTNAWQGWVVPTYVIKGDPKRGIKPMAPDLKSVHDLPKYWKVFKDPSDPTKGRFVSNIPGSEMQIINERKFLVYGLGKYYNILEDPEWGCDYGLVDAYENGQPWLGYYWTPSWVMGKFDMTPIEEPPFAIEQWGDNFGCAHPPNHVNILVHASLMKRAPEVVAFLKKYNTDIEINNQFLAQMDDNMSYTDKKKVNINKAAIWFLKNYESLWTSWIPEDVAIKVKMALK